MKPVKKLRLILEDTLSLMAELEGRNRNVLLQFTCYRNNGPVYQSTPVKRSNVARMLPEACRQNKATELSLLVTGTNQQLETVELHRASFTLATKARQQHPQQNHPNNPQPIHYQQNGLGSYEPYPAMPQAWPGLAGLGAPPEAMAIAQQMAHDMRFRDDHERLSVEAEGLRRRVKELEQEIQEHEATIEAKSSVINMMEQLKPFLPLATSLLGIDSRAGMAVAGLAGPEDSQGQDSDDPLTTAAIDMVREFMGTLHPTHRSELIWIMQNVRQDNNLISRLAGFLKQIKTAQQKNSTATQRPEQSQMHEQGKARKEEEHGEPAEAQLIENVG